MPIARLQRAAGIPKISIHVGQAHAASYQIKLKLKNMEWQELSATHSADLSKATGVTTTADLMSAMLDWDVRVVRSTTGTGESYFVDVRIEQDGVTIEGDPPPDTGAFVDGQIVKRVSDFRGFVVV